MIKTCRRTIIVSPMHSVIAPDRHCGWIIFRHSLCEALEGVSVHHESFCCHSHDPIKPWSILQATEYEYPPRGRSFRFSAILMRAYEVCFALSTPTLVLGFYSAHVSFIVESMKITNNHASIMNVVFPRNYRNNELIKWINERGIIRVKSSISQYFKV